MASVGNLIPEAQVAATGGGEIPGIVASRVYAGGRRITDICIDEAGEWSRRPEHVVWIGLYQPSMELPEQVRAQFALYHLAVEDTRHAH